MENLTIRLIYDHATSQMAEMRGRRLWEHETDRMCEDSPTSSTNNVHCRKLSDASFRDFVAFRSRIIGFPAKTPEPEVETQIQSGNLDIFYRSPQITFMVENSPTIPSGTFRQLVQFRETVFPPKLRNRKWKPKSGSATSKYFHVSHK